MGRAPSNICTAQNPLLVNVVSSKVNGSSSAAYATVWLRGVALCTLAQQHAYITEHVLGGIQCPNVYTGVIMRLSSGMFSLCRFSGRLVLLFASAEALKAPFIFPHIPAGDKSAVLLQPVFCSSARRGREQKREEKKPCAVQTQFCMQHWRAPVRREQSRGEEGVKGERKGKGAWLIKKREGKAPVLPMTMNLGYCRYIKTTFPQKAQKCWD